MSPQRLGGSRGTDFKPIRRSQRRSLSLYSLEHAIKSVPPSTCLKPELIWILYSCCCEIGPIPIFLSIFVHMCRKVDSYFQQKWPVLYDKSSHTCAPPPCFSACLPHTSFLQAILEVKWSAKVKVFAACSREVNKDVKKNSPDVAWRGCGGYGSLLPCTPRSAEQDTERGGISRTLLLWSGKSATA